MELSKITLHKNQKFVALDAILKNATDGTPCEFETKVDLATDDEFLQISFECLSDEFVSQNNMETHNEPLYNQEVFEVFISPSKNDAKKYLEIEINPNNAIWVGKINNPSLGQEAQTLEGMIEHVDAGIEHAVEKGIETWKGKLNIPWKLIGKDENGEYRINFYRIRSNKFQDSADWVCDTETCDFVCWSSTLSGQSPAFHRPKRFGFLKIID